MTLICSNCGAKRYVAISEAKKAVGEGWRTVGNAAYCPECSRTWKDRNGREIPPSESGSYWRIVALMAARFEDFEKEAEEKHGR